MKKIYILMFCLALLSPSKNYAVRPAIELQQRQSFEKQTKKFIKITGTLLAIGFVAGIGERMYDQHILKTVKTALDLTNTQTLILLLFRLTSLAKNCTAFLFTIASIYHAYNLLEIYALKTEVRFQPTQKKTVS